MSNEVYCQRRMKVKKVFYVVGPNEVPKSTNNWVESYFVASKK